MTQLMGYPHDNMEKIRKRYMKKVLGIYFLPLLFFSSLWGQKPYLQFEHYTSAQGLSQNSVYEIIQDNKGFMWFATQDGLNRFDGYTFKVFRNTNHLRSTASNYIYSMAEDKYGRIWIGTTTGLAIFHPENRTYTDIEVTRNTEINRVLRASDGSMWVAINKLGVFHFSVDGSPLAHYSKELVSPEITCLYEDDKQRIWAGSAYQGITIINPQTETFTTLSNPTLKKIMVTAIKGMPSGEYWIGSRQKGLLRYRPSEKSISRISANDSKTGLSNNNIKNIFSDRKQRTWIATEDGLNLYDDQNNFFHTYHYDQADPGGLSNNDINYIFEDRSGALWLAMNNTGICRYSPNLTYFRNYDANSRKTFLSSNIVWSFYEQDDGTVMIGSEAGLDIYNPQTQTVKSITKDNSPLKHNTIRDIYKDDNGYFWLATDGGGLARYNPATGGIKNFNADATDSSSISSNIIRHILKRDDHSLWIATLEGLNILDLRTNTFSLIQKRNSENSLSDNRILNVYQYKESPVFICTYNGLSLYNPQTKNFKNYQRDLNNPSSIRSNIIISVLHRKDDPDNVFWLGTSEGLSRFDMQTGKFTTYTTADGLPNNIIYAIEEDHHGNLWLSTNKGLSRMDYKSKTFRNFNLQDGLRNDEFSANASIQLKNGEIWFGGVEGITAFNPDNIGINRNIPPVAVTSFSIYDKEVPVDSILSVSPRIELSYKDKFFKIEFAALEFTNPHKNRYKYKLDGFDTKWIDAGYSHTASYTNLDGGEYVFRVIASNNDGIWNEEGLAIPVYIKPPFWETVWFIGAVILLLILTVVLGVNLRLNSIKKQREELKQKVHDRTAELLKRNIELKRSQAEQRRILLNVEEGFFLLDTAMIIQNAYSKSLEKIMESTQIAGLTICDVLALHIEESQMEMTRDYLSMLLDDSLDEELIENLNPLTRIKTTFSGENDSFSIKYLDFRFKRILENEKITGLIATVSDVTEEYLLGIKLAESEAKSKKQIEWMLGILHIEPALLIEFNESAHKELEFINTIMAGSDKQADYPQLGEQIARSLHLIKGNANLLKLDYFADMVHQIETRTSELRNIPALSGSDFITVFVDLDRLKKELNELGKLIEKLAQFSAASQKKPRESEKSGGLIRTIKNYAQRIASEMGLHIQLDTSRFDIKDIPANQLMVLKDIFIQLIRNSLSHGIEPPEERIKKGKPETGRIELSLERKTDFLHIRFSDDGRGLQFEKIIEKARYYEGIELSMIESWSRPQLAELIFHPGFTSKDKADMYSGRGAGMDLVRERLKKHGGQIEVDSVQGEYCTFIIKLATTHQN